MSVVGALERYVLQKVPVMVREPGGRIAEWSGGMQKLYSYSAAQAIGQIAQDLLRTEFPKPLPRIEEEVRDTGHWRGELQEARASGEALVVRSEWSLIDDLGSDASDRFMVWNADVTALSRTQADLQFLASIVEGSQDAVISKDLSGTITSWNKAAEDIFGYAANEIVGQPVLTLFPEDLFEEEQMILAKLKRGERIDHYETTRVHKDGHEFYVSLTLSPIRDRSGRIIGASKIVRDVTERKQLRSSLEEVQAELLHVSRLNDMGQVASGLAHELNQPLSAASLYLAGARRQIAAGKVPNGLEGCERAAAQIARAGEVIKRLRDFVAKGASETRNEDLGQVLREAAELALLGKAGLIEVEFDIPAEATSAVIDKIQIQQVVVNVVRNAAEAMDGQLAVETADHFRASAQRRIRQGRDIGHRSRYSGRSARQSVPALHYDKISRHGGGLGFVPQHY